MDLDSPLHTFCREAGMRGGLFVKRLIGINRVKKINV